MSDLINRQAAIDEVHGAIYEFFDICDDDEESPMTYNDEKLLELNKAITTRLKQLPSTEKTGKWFDKGSLSCRCSECGCKSPKEYNFCPNCGSDNRGVK